MYDFSLYQSPRILIINKTINCARLHFSFNDYRITIKIKY